MLRKRTAIEVIMFLTYALFAMSWVAGSLMTTEVMAFYGIEGLASATWATNAITIAKIIGNLLAASLLMKLGPKKAFAFASCLVIVGALGALSEEYSFYVFGRAVLGFGGAFLVVYFNPVVVHYFRDQQRVVVNGINAVAFNTGNLLAIIFTGLLLSYFKSWQAVILSISAASSIMLLLWWFFCDDFTVKNHDSDQGQPDYTLMDGLKEPVNWHLAIAYSGVLFFYLSAFTIFPMVPGFAVDTSSLSLVLVVAAIIGTGFGITATRVFSLRIPVIRYCGLMIPVCVAVMILSDNPLLAYCAAFGAGFFKFMPMTTLITLPQELPGVTPARITVVFCIYWSVSYSIETVLMFLAGLMADLTGNMMVAAGFVVVCSATLFVSSFFLPETGRQRATGKSAFA